MRSNNNNVNNENIIPNVDFLLNTQDISTKGTDLDVPVFSYSIQKCDTCKGGIAVPYSADGAALQHGHMPLKRRTELRGACAGWLV